MELILMARGDVLRQRIEGLLREEFSDKELLGSDVGTTIAAVRSGADA